MRTVWTPNNEHGLSQDQINTIMNELLKMQLIYPNVVIEEIGDYYTRDKNKHEKSYQALISDIGKEEADALLKRLNAKSITFESSLDGLYEDKDSIATYFSEERAIYFNHVSWKYSVPLDEYIRLREITRQRIEKRKKLGLEKHLRSVNEIVAKNLQITTWHEFSHAITYQYSIDKNNEIVELFDIIPKETVMKELGEYATKDIYEFIAEAFEESMLESYGVVCSPLARDIRTIMDRIVADSKPMSEKEKLYRKLGVS